MFMRGTIVAAGCGVLAFACTAPPDETQTIIDNLVKAGFPASDIAVVNGTVYVGGDAEVSLADRARCSTSTTPPRSNTVRTT